MTLLDSLTVYNCPILKCELSRADVYLITLEAPESQSFQYQPGQYLFVEMAPDDCRPYSIASVSQDGKTLQMHIKDIPGNDFTGQVLEVIKKGTHLKVRLAAGSCTIDRSTGDKSLLFIAGGTGFAHSHSIIESLLANDDSRAIYLYWGANKEDEFYLQEKVVQWHKTHSNFHFFPVVFDPNSDWDGETGMVHEAVFNNISELSDFDIFVSGSSAMVFNIYRQLKTKNVPKSQIYSDMLDIVRDKDD